jgi:hypothetical protein
MAAKTILAVAIANTQKSQTITDASAASLSGVRPYIKGLIQRLDICGFEIGTNNHYVIDYRETPQAQLSSIYTGTPDFVLCMSSTVLAAVPSTWAMPIVAIVSDVPSPLPSNVCGISGERHQIARDYYDKLLATIPNLQNVYVLHKDNYQPSVKALAKIQTGSHPATVVPVPVGSPYGDADIQNAISGITNTAASALLVLPADSFFGSANNIIALAHAKTLPDFWPVTDWVRHSASAASAVGGYGFPQVRCGELLADRIASLWSTGAIPNPAFKKIDNSEAVWLVSDAAAANLRVTPSTRAGLRHV